jgi:hypothetical protein
MERFKLGPEKSFSVLRRYSQQHNMKLHEVAGSLVRTGRLPAEPTGPTAIADADPEPADPSIAG